MKTLSILALFQEHEQAAADLTKRPAPPQRQPKDIAQCEAIVKAIIKWQMVKQGKLKGGAEN